MTESSIYLDSNASTPTHPEVAKAMIPWLTDYHGNPSSTHTAGKRARAAIDQAREQVATLLQCNAQEIVFTSGGTEANNHAIQGACLPHLSRRGSIVTSTIEHPAVNTVCTFLERLGFTTCFIPVDEKARIDLTKLEESLTDSTRLITVMHANNEVGTLQPLQEIAKLAKARNILLHTDAAQSAGKVDTRVEELGVDLLSIAGHKLYAPKGVGALYIRDGVRLDRFMHGADHEGGRRAGTEAVAQIVSLGKACEIAHLEKDTRRAHLRSLRDQLEKRLLENIPEARVNGHLEHRLPNTLSLSIPGVNANDLLARIPGLAASTSAACHSGAVTKSAVLSAMGVSDAHALGTLRLSTGCFNTMEEIEEAAKLIINAAKSGSPMS